ncbi:hypothetical protein [Pontibacter chinhatensis]|uniref:Nucleotidyltransferase n=1 Tax=Pontibacter chinhatensis TaxID=1436961 RepID=A0A1I2Z736_9BACT|nr:hypothetical protein [Pontibacter chinhatensis]SFH33673.1 hypothetical protein SAMN05421739_11216 [Pontibacter chinhatensis]
MLSQDFREFVELLNKHKVKYLIVGGYAVGIHGHPRYTGDLDVWISPDEETANTMVEVMQEFGFGSFGLTEKDFLTKENIIQLGYPPLRIDVLTSIDGVKFEECYPNKVVLEDEGIPVSFISLKDLRKNKESSGRRRDLDDLENLT